MRIKRHPTKADKFYNVDQWKWYLDGMVKKDYEDQVQIQVRKLLNRAMIETFDLFTFEYDAVLEKYYPHLPMAHDACICKVIRIVKATQVQCVIEMNAEVAEIQNTNPTLAANKRSLITRFTDTCALISNGYIARMLLNAISQPKSVKIGIPMVLIWEQLFARWPQCFPAWTVLRKDL